MSKQKPRQIDEPQGCAVRAAPTAAVDAGADGPNLEDANRTRRTNSGGFRYFADIRYEQRRVIFEVGDETTEQTKITRALNARGDAARRGTVRGTRLLGT